MALFFADLVREACWDEGAGALALAGALPGHRAFADAVPPGARFHYAIAGSTRPDEWEVGEGELDGAGKLARQPIASSGGGAVDFSPGLKTVALTVLADWFANLAGATGIGDVEGLSEALAGKAAVSHSHAIGEVTGLGPALDAKAALTGASFAGAISAPSLTLGNDLAVADGGTGASSAAAARTNLGLGTLATQNANAVTIGGGAIAGLSSLGVTGNVNITDGGLDVVGSIQQPWMAAHNHFVGTQFSTSHENGLRFLEATRETRIVAKAADENGFISFHTGSSPTKRAEITNNGFSVTGSGTFTGTATNLLDVESSSPDVARFTSGGAYVYVRFRNTGGTPHAWAISSKAAGFDIYNETAAATVASFTTAGIFITGGLDVASGAFSVAGTQIAGPRRTGWSNATGTASRTGFDTASVTTEGLAQRVKSLIDDLTAHGLIGS